MPEAFKRLLSEELVRLTGGHLDRVLPRFPRRRFEALALEGFAALEMKARAMRIADALQATLPTDFDAAATAIEATLAPVRGDEPLAALRPSEQGLAGWIGWPLGEYVARVGLQDPVRALRCLHALTRRFSAEFAIRPFILAQPGPVFETLQHWTRDASPHVRRLVSEGSRPRLPWGLQLKPLIADPSPTLPLLRALQDDDSEYVRRSVANHLNDIAKDHPAVVAAWLEEFLPDADGKRRALLRHASRTLIKRGDPRVLAAWGLAAPLAGSVAFVIQPKQIPLGGAVDLQLTLESDADRAQTLAIDYRIHHLRADGRTAAKVFKGWKVVLAPGECRRLTRRHAMKLITTRRYYPGVHQVELQINGQVVASAGFELLG